MLLKLKPLNTSNLLIISLLSLGNMAWAGYWPTPEQVDNCVPSCEAAGSSEKFCESHCSQWVAIQPSTYGNNFRSQDPNGSFEASDASPGQEVYSSPMQLRILKANGIYSTVNSLTIEEVQNTGNLISGPRLDGFVLKFNTVGDITFKSVGYKY